MSRQYLGRGSKLSGEAKEAEVSSAARILPPMAVIQEGLQAAKAKFSDPIYAPVRRFDTNGHALVELIQFDDTGAALDRALYASVDLLQSHADSSVDLSAPMIQLSSDFRDWLLAGIPSTPGRESPDSRAGRASIMQAQQPVRAYMAYAHRSSVINLQQEVEMHMRLSMRCVQKKYSTEFTDQHLQVAFENAALNMNAQVRDIFVAALTATTIDGAINLVELNAALDRARKVLLPITKAAMADALLSLCHDTTSVERLDLDLMNESVAAVEGSDLLHTSATSADYLFTDNVAGSCVWVEGSDHTAHNKVVGADIQARRQFQRFSYDPVSEALAASPTARVEARVPSLSPADVVKPEAISDVAEKLMVDQRELSTAGSLGSPMVYNLLTSLNGFIKDKTLDHKNRQRQSAKRILMAAHRMNREQLRPGRKDPLPFCLVANIPVNQHTEALRLSSARGPENDVLREASLMAEVAILSTLSQRSEFLPAPQCAEVASHHQQAQELYTKFLLRHGAPLGESDPTPVYFYKSKQGMQLTEALSACNDRCARYLPVTETKKRDSLEVLVTKAMFRMHATGEYRNPKYGLMVQSMLVFLQDKSLYGCKSANERFKAVEGRVDLFHVLTLAESRRGGVSDEHADLRDALRQFCHGAGSMDALQAAVDIALDAHCLYGAGMFVSSVDQGGAPKTLSFDSESRSPSFFKSPSKALNTNFAETSRAWKQSKASKWQAHKGDHASDLSAAWREAVAARPEADDDRSKRLAAEACPF
ncbi:MAG: hypothetical protein P1U40_04670 [Coxiellaceae bacterium]|nr:hypothetical protein [Coxiellaceae bacterium]